MERTWSARRPSARLCAESSSGSLDVEGTAYDSDSEPSGALKRRRSCVVAIGGAKRAPVAAPILQPRDFSLLVSHHVVPFPRKSRAAPPSAMRGRP